VDGHNLAGFVEEIEVERESHAEGVDAGAARNQQTRSGFVAAEVSEAEQTGTETAGHANLSAEGRGERKTSQARGGATGRHGWVKGELEPSLPLSGANALSGTGTQGHGTTMTGMIQHLLSLGWREQMASTHG
jgi:hypothetical protein